jgi:hypothetical protein
MADEARPKDPDEVRTYHFVFCSEDGTNDGGASDTGDLQGDTISSITTVEVVSDDSFTIDSTSKSGVTVKGVVYPVDTVVTATYSAGTDGTDVHVLCRVATSGGESFDKTMIVPVRSQ